MRWRWGMATVAAALAAGAVLAAWAALELPLPTEASRHDRAVRSLERAAEEEQGWVVVALPVRPCHRRRCGDAARGRLARELAGVA